MTYVLHSKADVKSSAENPEVKLGARKSCINYSRKMVQQVKVLAAEPGNLGPNR